MAWKKVEWKRVGYSTYGCVAGREVARILQVGKGENARFICTMFYGIEQNASEVMTGVPAKVLLSKKDAKVYCVREFFKFIRDVTGT